MSAAQLNKTELSEIFDECFKLEEPTEHIEFYAMSEVETRACERFKVSINANLIGITLKNQRYISDGAFIISTFAIVHMPEWQIFRHLFKTLGDNWSVSTFAAEAKQAISPFSNTDHNHGRITTAIERWSEDMGVLEPVALVENIAIYRNTDKKPIFVWDAYDVFMGQLGFYLNDVKDPYAPISLTCESSGGFAGLLMPLYGNTLPIATMTNLLKEAICLLDNQKKGGYSNDW